MTTPNVNDDLPGFYEWLRNKALEEAKRKESELVPLELTIEAPTLPPQNTSDNSVSVNFEIDMNEVDHNTVSEDILKF